MNLFDRCISVILKNEGEYQNDPDDLGNWTGPNKTGLLKGTKYGICARSFPDEDIFNLTLKRAEQIYYDNFWRPMNLKGIKNDDLVLHIFDHGVNAGKRTAIRMIQRIVEVNPDGLIGQITKNAINNWNPITKVIDGYGLLNSIVDHYKYARHCYYSDIARRRPVAGKYLKGWLSRIQKTNF